MANFFNLPAELRNRIYRDSLVKHWSIKVSGTKVGDVKGHFKGHLRYYDKPIEPCLLATSRQVRREALPVFWGANVFECPDQSVCKRFVRYILDGKQGRFAMVRTLRVDFYPGMNIDCVVAR